MRNFRVAAVSAVAVLCLVAVGTNGQAADDTDETLFLTFRSEELRRMCPDGVKKCHCAHSPGTYIDGPFDFATDPIGTVLTYGGCNPDFCTCNGSTEEFDARPAEMQKVQGLCERNEINRCLCHDKEIAEFPFDLRTFYFECRPTKCKCNGVKRPQTVTGFGCRKGGFPYCDSKFDFVCRNGDKVNRLDILRNRLDRAAGGNPGCICSDNHRPVCKTTGKEPKCPNGDDIDLTVGSPGGYFDECDSSDPK